MLSSSWTQQQSQQQQSPTSHPLYHADGWLSEFPQHHDHAHDTMDLSFFNSLMGFTDASLFEFPFQQHQYDAPSLDLQQHVMASGMFSLAATCLNQPQLYDMVDPCDTMLSVDPRFVSQPYTPPPPVQVEESLKAKRPRGRPKRSPIVRTEPYSMHRPAHDPHAIFINTFVTAQQQQQQQQLMTPNSPASLYSSLYHDLSSNDSSAPSTPQFKARHIPDLYEPTTTFACHWTNCAQVYSTLDHLVEHVVLFHVQSGRSFYVCDWQNCPRNGASFTKRHKMLTHVRTHTGEKPFTCSYTNCNRAFTRADARVAHERIHENIRPYACTVEGCERRYFHARSLRKHIKVHAERMVTSEDDEEESEEE